MAACGEAEPITLQVQVENLHSVRKTIAYGSTKSFSRSPSKPNAVRRGANHHTMRRPAWFARGLTAGRLSRARALDREDPV